MTMTEQQIEKIQKLGIITGRSQVISELSQAGQTAEDVVVREWIFDRLFNLHNDNGAALAAILQEGQTDGQ